MRWLVVLLLVGGCAHQTAAELQAERDRRQKCASIEIYPSGIAPPHPYRVLGPISADYDGIPSHRDQTLRDNACGLGADAIIDVQESNPTSVQSVGGSMEGGTAASGTAVAYTDRAAPTPPPMP